LKADHPHKKSLHKIQTLQYKGIKRTKNNNSKDKHQTTENTREQQKTQTAAAQVEEACEKLIPSLA
jgi:hypothetical protein